MFQFLKQTFRDFHYTGAVAPSSHWLARALTEPLAERGDEPIEILEAGPGTGALTEAIVRQLRHGDRLTLCEINNQFVEHLERRFRDDPRLSPWRGQTTIHHGAVEELGMQPRFTHIVCGLPFNNFEQPIVAIIFDTLEAVLLPGGTVSFFEYAGIRRLKSPFVGQAERMRLRGVAAELESRIRVHQTACRLVALNAPPAWARCLKY
ncbi:MAG: methyltransferase domain-containing protein [bacterium]|nr:methyltransferase domain-containing protein [Candidatus Sumerlaeota bacterium]